MGVMYTIAHPPDVVSMARPIAEVFDVSAETVPGAVEATGTVEVLGSTVPEGFATVPDGVWAVVGSSLTAV